MRRAMICVTVMLALIQLWPVVFGPGSPVVAIAAPVRPGAAVMAVPAARPAPIGERTAGMATAARFASGKSCYQQYRAAETGCDGERSCRIRAADRLTLCEASSRGAG